MGELDRGEVEYFEFANDPSLDDDTEEEEEEEETSELDVDGDTVMR